jgi:2-polyprenyl-6-methoxyphenol hydroxylase-like FAD-dependent oxidoreductase
MMLFERMKLIEMLYEQLPNKSKVKTSKSVITIEQDDTEVKVVLEDGTCETGDVVIGADGVHSFVRDQMQDDPESKTDGSGKSS